MESGSDKRSAEDPDNCTNAFPAPRQDPVCQSENVTGEEPYTFQLFAGSCQLSKRLKLHGFPAVGVDHKNVRIV